jgi:hypothetical protein
MERDSGCPRAGQPQCRYFRGTDTWDMQQEQCSEESAAAVTICSDSRQVSAVAEGIAERGIGDVWVQRRRALARRKMAWSHCLGSISEIQPACWSRLPAGRTGQYTWRLCARHKYRFVGMLQGSSKGISFVSAGRYCTMSGVSWLRVR